MTTTIAYIPLWLVEDSELITLIARWQEVIITMMLLSSIIFPMIRTRIK
jgi:hypothetical protein